MSIPSNGTVFEFRLDPSELSRQAITAIRFGLVVRAILAVLLGALVLAWPQVTLGVVGVLFGFYFVIVGLVRVMTGLFARSVGAGGRILNVLLGVALLIAGIFAIKNPIDSVVVLGVIIGVAWIVEGIAAVAESTKDSSGWFGLLFGVISVIAGVTVLFLPLISVALLVIVGGVFLVIVGVTQFIAAITFARG